MFRSYQRIACWILFFVLPWWAAGCSDSSNPASPPVVGDAPATVATSWFDLAYNVVKVGSLPPPSASRIYGYAGVTLYEALVPGMPGYQSLVGQVNGLTALARTTAAYARPAAEEFHWPLVANSAMAAILRDFFANGPAAGLDSINRLEDSLNTQLGQGLASDVYQRSVDRGKLVASDIFAWSTSDGFAQYSNCAWTPPSGAGLWVPTPPGFLAALQPCWGQLRTFALVDGQECAPPPPPAYDETPGSPFDLEMREVYDTAGALTQVQKDIALFWADGPGVTGTPPGHSISILSQVLKAQNASLALAAESYAKVGMAVADAFIACWNTKFQYSYLRPITAIRSLVDSTWLSFIPTPNFPEYTSGHSVQSGAASEVMTDLFGPAYAFTDHTHDARGLTPRSFGSFYEAAGEAALSRLYGGIHYRSAIENGITQGRCIGQKVNALAFKPST